MPIALQVTVIVVLLALVAALVPLLIQLRRTAMGLEVFLASSRKDLAQIAEDVHASRLRMDHLAGSFQIYLDELLSFVQVMGEMGRTVRQFHARFNSTLESASRNVGGMLGAISGLMSFFHRNKTPHAPEQEK